MQDLYTYFILGSAYLKENRYFLGECNILSIFSKLFSSPVIIAYPPNEIVDMIGILGEAGNYYSAVERLYAERYLIDVIRVERP